MPVPNEKDPAPTAGGDNNSSVFPLETVVDNLPVRTLSVGGLTVEGYSRAAVQSYWRIPELKIAFDIGGSPWSFMGTQTYMVTHAHLDHMASLPVLVARRRMMKMAPPTIYLPAEVVEDTERMLRSWQKLDRGRMICDLVPVTAGQEIELSREYVATVFATTHTVPSVGYIVWERRKKLKPELVGLSQNEIRDMRMSGQEVSHEVRVPIVCYTGDTSPKGLDQEPAVFQAKILICEVTFFRPEHRKEKIHKFGHTHLDDILERADKFENEKIIFCHLSTRYDIKMAVRGIEKKLPESLKSRVEIWN
jgi:ribonuclease Z